MCDVEKFSLRSIQKNEGRQNRERRVNDVGMIDLDQLGRVHALRLHIS